MADVKQRKQMRQARHGRIRRRLTGTPERPRLVIFKSAKHFYAQVVDDTTGTTITGVSSLTPDVKKVLAKAKGMEMAKAIGKAIASVARQKNIDKVVLDRGGFPYTGRIKAFAEAARAEGLQF